jgi:hypothetical protein
MKSLRFLTLVSAAVTTDSAATKTEEVKKEEVKKN